MLQPPPAPPAPAATAAEELGASWLTVYLPKGWPASVVLHAIVLLVLVFWNHAPIVATQK